MAEEEKTTGTEEEVLTDTEGEGGEETTPTEEGSQTGEATPKEGEDGEGEGGAGKPMGYEVTYPDGRKEFLTPEEYNERLTNYPKLKGTLDRQANELGELRRLKEPTKQQTQQAKQTVADSGRTEEFTEDEIEDPGLRAKLNRVVAKNIELEQQVKGIPNIVNEATEKGRMRAQIESVIQNHPGLKGKDPEWVRITVENAINYGIARNNALGQEVYKTPNDCVTAYLDASQGKKQTISASAVVRELRKDSGQVLVPSGTKTPVDVVAKFNAMTDPQERANYLDSLSEEERAKVEKEIIG